MAYFSEDAKKKIISVQPAAATWLRGDGPARTTPGTKAPQASKTPNKFPGSCQKCHGHVAAGEGILGGKIGGKFVIYHADGTCPDKQTPTATAPVATPQTRPAKPNKYAGACAHCGTWVAAETGILIKAGTGWKAAHHDGTCPQTTPEPAQTPAPAPVNAPVNLYGGRCIHCADWVEAEAGIRVKAGTGWKVAHNGLCPEQAEWTQGERIGLTAEQIAQLPGKGYATVQFDGDQYRTFRIRTRKPDLRLYPGAIEIAYLNGPNNNADYMPLGVVVDGGLQCRTEIHNEGMRTALLILLGDPAAAQRGWSRANEACARCGRHLSNPDSLDIYLGPECATK